MRRFTDFVYTLVLSHISHFFGGYLVFGWLLHFQRFLNLVSNHKCYISVRHAKLDHKRQGLGYILTAIVVQSNPAISKSQGKWKQVRNSGASK